MMIFRIICRCGVVLIDPQGAESVRVTPGTVLPLECPHCGEAPVIEVRRRGEESPEGE